jgi:predicted deacylase
MIRRGNNIPIITEINLEDTPENRIRNYWLKLISDGLGNPINVPVIVARGKEPGPILGVTAAIHGNELNGIPVIQRLFAEIETETLKGTIIGVPVVNILSFMRKKRRFIDGVDLNHIMPGKRDGNVSQVYAYRFIERIVKQFDYLLDLHTASFGRVNSYYVRADMEDEATRKLALLQNAEIIVHNPPSDGTLRGSAEDLSIPAITLELGNPNTFQKKYIRSGEEGIHNVLSHLGMIPDTIEEPTEPTVICKSSYWIYTDMGGLLTVTVQLKEKLKKGDRIAILRDVFGNFIKEYHAPEAGIVIGKSSSPVNQSGGRILHLGILK